MRRSLAVPGLAFLAALALYVATAAPGAVGGDPGEMQFVPYVLGIAHWTGYPLQTLAGKLWLTILPVGSVAYRMNLLSAFLSAATVALACAAGRRLSGSWLGGLMAAATLAFSSLFWSWAIVAGVRSPTVFFAVLNLALALEWGDAVAHEDTRADRWLWALAVAFGLSLAHHRTTIFLIPALAVYLLASDRSLIRRWRLWLSLLATAVILPALIYLYLPLRGAMHPAYAVIETNTLRGFISLAFAPGLGVGIAAPLTAADLPPRLADAIRLFSGQFTWPLVALGIAGALTLLVRRPWAGLLLALPFVIFVGFTVNYSMGGSDLNVVYMMPAYAIFSLWIGCGLAAIVQLLDRSRQAGRVAAALLVGAAALYLALSVGRPTLQGIEAVQIAPLDSARYPLRGRQAQRLLDLGAPYLPAGAVLIGDWEQLTPFWYGQLVEHTVSNLTFHYPFEPDGSRWISEALTAGKQVFLTRRSDQVIGRRFLSAAGPLVAVQSAPRTALPSSATPLAASFGDQMALLGFSYSGLLDGSLQRGSVLSVELYWQALRRLTTNYSVSVRLVRDGRVISSVDNAHPVLAMYPTSLWQEAEVVGDYYELPAPRSLASGDYHVQIVLYSQEGGTFRNLPAQSDGAQGESVALPALTVR